MEGAHTDLSVWSLLCMTGSTWQASNRLLLHEHNTHCFKKGLDDLLEELGQQLCCAGFPQPGCQLADGIAHLLCNMWLIVDAFQQYLQNVLSGVIQVCLFC